MTQNSRGRSFVPTRVAGRAVAAGLSAGLVVSAFAAAPAFAAGNTTINGLPGTSNVETARLAGADRFATANALSAAAWVASPGAGQEAPKAVVIARGDIGIDALSASALAGAERGPVLLSNSKSLPTSVVLELSRLKTAAGGSIKVFIVGGTGAISADVENTINAVTGATAVRLGGATRYETAAKVAARVQADAAVAPTNVIIARGDLLADALTAGPAAFKLTAPVLLTKPGALPDETLAALKNFASSTNVQILGGTGAVSTAVETQLKGMFTTVNRFGGSTRYETARLFAENFESAGAPNFGTNDLVLARGDADNFADALAAGPYAGLTNEPILLVSGVNSIPAPTVQFHTDHKTTIVKITASGGAGVFSDAALGAAAKAAGDTMAPMFTASSVSGLVASSATGAVGSNHSYVLFTAAPTTAGASNPVAGVLGNGVVVNLVKGTSTQTAAADASLSTDGRTVTVKLKVDATTGDVIATTSDVATALGSNGTTPGTLATSPVYATPLDGTATGIATTGSVTLSGGTTKVTAMGKFNDSLLATTPGVANFGLDLDNSNLTLEVASASTVTKDDVVVGQYNVVFNLTAAQVGAQKSTPKLYVSGVADLAGNVNNAFAS